MNKIQISTDAISTTRLQLGFQGENEHTQVVIYWSTLYSKYPNAVATMVVKPPVGDAYPKAITQTGNKVVWEVTSTDVYNQGNGEYQLTFTDGTEIIKTYIGSFTVNASLSGTGEAPDPVQDWLTEANAVLADLEAFEDVTVTGTTPSITGAANRRYLCGEVSSISITAPESGMIDVVFTSGSTPAVLTATGITFPDWFDSTTLETNTRYELNILDRYGVVVTWQIT